MGASGDLSGYRTLAILEQIQKATTAEAVLKLYEKVLAEIGAEYIGILFLPRPEDRVEDAALAWKVPEAWRKVYSGENFCQRDPANRQCRRSVMPYDWATVPCDPETEPHMQEVLDRARDFNVHKGVGVPVPSPSGIIGCVWVAGPNFDEREIHKPVLQSLGYHVFHRLQQILGRQHDRVVRLTGREREVLAWASEGKTSWEIGCILNLSQRTVEWHFSQACKKLGATNRLQAIAMVGNTRTILEH